MDKENKFVAISFTDGGYYEDSIGIELVREDYEGFESHVFILKDKKDLLEAFEFLYDTPFSDNFEELPVKQYKNIIRNLKNFTSNEFNEVIKKYMWLYDLREKAYTYDKDVEYYNEIFGCERNFGTFYQNILPFNDWDLLLFKTYESFIEDVLDRVSEGLRRLTYVGEEDRRIAELKGSVDWCERNIKQRQKEIENYKKSKKKHLDEIKELEKQLKGSD
jgi:hypothetical protein